MTDPPQHKMRSKSDSYSYVIDKAMDIERSMGYQGVINQNITPHETSFERENAINWYNKLLAKCYSEFICTLTILTLIPLVMILGFNYYSNRTESYVSGRKFFLYDFKGVAPLNNGWGFQPGEHICDSVPDSAQCYETYVKYNLGGFILSFVVIILVLSTASHVVHRRLCADIEEMQGRLIRYEDLLNNEGQLYTKVISEILSGSSKKEILEEDSQVTNAKMASKKDSADADLEMDRKK
ncbi:uncharacterized protein EAF01_004664 [Botrytis porri]|uniref:Uncharacterized protein n=1 Tax=Botrytis porri TaxID=87229 RepID=A0A4Z1KVI5_9HELO|nr:uncharacterized protein EAF01_004664 [Botrytis porri]KAF7907077.1 hypothetical protein EAF01_004664 [Botrytis porri]TGO88511.1 hypothetical protein BPOR_0158g00110 [Botrytis porri]